QAKFRTATCCFLGSSRNHYSSTPDCDSRWIRHLLRHYPTQQFRGRHRTKPDWPHCRLHHHSCSTDPVRCGRPDIWHRCSSATLQRHEYRPPLKNTEHATLESQHPTRAE